MRIRIGLLSFIIVFLIGCSNTPESISNDTVILTATEAEFSTIDSAMHYEIELTYPVIDANITPERLNRINNTIAEKFYTFSDQKNFIESHQNLPEHFYEAESEWFGELKNTYSITQCDSILNISFTFYHYYLGAAHGYTSNESLKFNTSNGDLMPITDFFKSDSTSLLKIRNTINAHLPDSICWGIENDSATLSSLANFIFTNDKIIFKFDDYAICPYAIGITNIAFDKSDFKEVMKLSTSQNCVEIAAVQDEGEIATH